MDEELTGLRVDAGPAYGDVGHLCGGVGAVGGGGTKGRVRGVGSDNVMASCATVDWTGGRERNHTAYETAPV